MNAYLKSDAGKAQIGKLGMTPQGGTPGNSRRISTSERAKWGPIIKEANITLQ